MLQYVECLSTTVVISCHVMNGVNNELWTWTQQVDHRIAFLYSILQLSLPGCVSLESETLSKREGFDLRSLQRLVL